MTLFRQPIATEPERPLRAWQAAAVPLVMDSIRVREEGIVVAVTGSGKSVALAEVIAQFLLEVPAGQVVVTTSSRRLVGQLAQTIGERVGHGAVGKFYSAAKDADRSVVVACNNSALALAAVLRMRQRGVDLWIADEAHRTEAEGLTTAANALKPVARVGFTATAYRSKESENLQLFARVIYRYGFGDALRDQVIVPWKVVPWTAAERPIDEAVLEMIQGHAEGPGVVNASSIEDAETFAAWLGEQGIPSLAVHSELTQEEQDRRLSQLRDGEVRVVVYPSLLSEGADFPWLRWICLRRKVMARVRFVQEVGRVLRTWPGKSEALVLDPHGLFGTFSLTYDEDLGEKPEEPPAEEGVERDAAERGSGPPSTAKPMVAVSAWARQLWLAAQLDGVVEPANKSAYGREEVATAAQVRAVSSMAPRVSKYLPPEHRSVAEHLARRGDLPSRGMASDLLDVLYGLGKHKAWTPSLPVWAPPAELLDQVGAELDAGGWWAAGASRGNVRAIAVMRGRRVVVAIAKVDEQPAQRLAVSVAAAKMAAREAGPGAIIQISDEWALRVLTGDAQPRHDAVAAALRCRAPEVEYRLEEGNPAEAIAWREVAKAQKAIAKGEQPKPTKKPKVKEQPAPVVSTPSPFAAAWAALVAS